jgi:hypothetical protein
MADASDFFQRLTHLSEDAMAVAERDIGVADDFGDVEYEVDLLHQTLHQGNRYLDSTKRYLDSVFSSLVDELRGAPAIPPPDDPTKPDTTSLLAAASAGPSRPRTTPLQLVRAFATADSQHQDPEVVARAAAIPAIATRTVPITPRRPATAVPTPRRASVYGQRLGTPGHR